MGKDGLVTVNLLSERKRVVGKQRILFAKIQMVTGVVLAGYIAVLVVVGSLSAAVVYKMNKAEDGIREEKLRLEQLKSTEGIYALVLNKLELLINYFENRNDIKLVLEELSALLPDGVAVAGVSISESGEVLKAEFETRDVYGLVNFLNTMEQVVSEKKYGVVSFEGLGRSADGIYNVECVINLGNVIQKREVS